MFNTIINENIVVSVTEKSFVDIVKLNYVCPIQSYAQQSSEFWKCL